MEDKEPANMLGVVYAGEARIALNEARLSELVVASEQRNARLGVTGHAYFHGGRWIEYLEGPREAVEEIIATLTQDPRFTLHQLLRSEAPAQRRFPDWRLDACDYTDLMDLRLEHVLEAMLHNLAEPPAHLEAVGESRDQSRGESRIESDCERTQAAVWRLVDAIARRRATPGKRVRAGSTRLVFAH
jgi:hypothetical protein